MALIKIEKIHLREDERGFSAYPLDEKLLKYSKVLNLHIVSMNPGAVRWNNYHKRQEEKIWIIGGHCFITAKNREEGEIEEIEVNPGNDTILTIIPGITHAIKNISNDTVYLLCYSDYSTSEEDMDVFRDKIVEWKKILNVITESICQ